MSLTISILHFTHLNMPTRHNFWHAKIFTRQDCSQFESNIAILKNDIRFKFVFDKLLITLPTWASFGFMVGAEVKCFFLRIRCHKNGSENLLFGKISISFGLITFPSVRRGRLQAPGSEPYQEFCVDKTMPIASEGCECQLQINNPARSAIARLTHGDVSKSNGFDGHSDKIASAPK